MTAWHESEESLYDFAKETAEEWWGLKVVDDRQYIALLMLLHEMHIRVFYEWRRDDEDN